MSESVSLANPVISMLTKILVLLISLLGLILLLSGLARLFRRKLLRGTLQSLGGLLLILAAILSWSVALNLYGYQRLTQERPVARLRFEALGPQMYRVYVIHPDQTAQSFELRGDEWQVDARVLKWSGLATLFGMETAYQLDRITGRYHDLQQERQMPRTIYSLYQQQGVDVWQLAHEHRGWIPWVDAVYGSATYMPMVDRAEYALKITTSGLIARADNEIAEEAIRRWR
jgi:hypothetical protein